MPALLPLFVNLTGRRVLLVGGGPVAAAKLEQLLAAGADVRVVSPEVHASILEAGVVVEHRAFSPTDLDDVWLVVAAATPDVNREVADAAAPRRLFVNAVDDPANATAFLSGVVRRDGVTIAISTDGAAPGLTALLRQALDALLPGDLARWVQEARRRRAEWRRNAVPMAARRPLLLAALNRLYGNSPALSAEEHEAASGPDGEGRRVQMAMTGRVWLVGAGPGDPGLVTRRAVTCLRHADLVLYDALVDERVLALARRARRFYVGKRAGRHSLSQADIHTLMIRAARRGQRVVRLKGGDPFVFGRGGEEARALQDAGIPVEIVPGVTSAVAAAALAGIPVTHRGTASAFLVISGHEVELFARTIGELTPEGVTLVVMMGLGHRAELARLLLDRGWRADLPAALVAEASRQSQQVWRGTLRAIAEEKAVVSGDGPATMVIGEVAGMRLAAERDGERDDATRVSAGRP